MIAKVKVNGKYLGELWSRPLQIDITDALHVGNNQLEIEVATTWVNRLVGDLKYPDVFPDSNTTKAFKTEITFESKNTELQPAGLIGPVQLKPIRHVKIK